MDIRTIVGIGGFPNERMLEYVLGLARGRRILVDTTANPLLGELPPWNAELTRFSF